jgi:hypothetical protein
MPPAASFFTGDDLIPPGVWTDARIALVRLPVVWRDI